MTRLSPAASRPGAPDPRRWLLPAMGLFGLLYWLFAWSLERPDLSATVARFWQAWVPFLPLPSPLVFLIEMVHPRVLRHLLPLAAGWWVARRAAVHLVHTLYQMPDLAAAADFLSRLQSGVATGKPVKVSEESLEEARRESALLRIGGPGAIKIQGPEVAVTELNGRFHRVLGAGTHRLARFEFVLALLDIRPQLRTVRNVSALTRDGIEVTADIQLRFRLDTGGEPTTPANPFPYSETAARLAAYSQAVLPDGNEGTWITLPQRRAGGLLAGILSQYRLDEIMELTSNVSQPVHAIQNELRRQLRTALRPYGIELQEALISRLELPREVTAQYIRYWKADWDARRRISAADGTAMAMEEMEIARAEAEMTMVQAIVDGVQRARREGNTARMSEIMALRLVDALEQVARRSQPLAPLPEELVPQLQSIRQRLLPAGPSTPPAPAPADDATAADPSLAADRQQS